MSTGPMSTKTPNSGSPTIGSVDALETVRRRRGAERQLRWILPVAALAIGALLLWLLVTMSPKAKQAAPEVALPLVRVEIAVPTTLRMNVTAHGIVTPRTESDVVAEVRGRIVQVSPSLVAGGFFADGDELLRLDNREARIAVDRARAQVRLRGSEANLASAEASRREKLSSSGAVSASDLEQFTSRALVADAALSEARAQLAQAELDLERTVMRAPFDGRVRERHVDVGQFVNPGATLARIYAVDYAEVRLPIATGDLRHLDLGVSAGSGWGPPAEVEGEPAIGAPVVLRARLGGQDLEWIAQLVRTEGEIDLKTRTVNVVARVDDPYGRRSEISAPLPAGLFVEATIEGREIEDVFSLPAMAVRDGDTVYVVDAENRLRMRPVTVLRRSRSEVVVGDGIEAGDQLIVSPLRAVSEGMELRIAGAPEEAASEAASDHKDEEADAS